MIAFVAMLFLPFALLAQTMDPAYGIVIDESFERGIPADWTQENVAGSISWIAENSDLAYPNTAADSLGRAAFRNTTGVTQKAVTRLILPAKDISGLFQPILVFSHAQDKWSGDFDSLRVLCRTSENGNWNTLISFSKYIPKWQRDTVFLPAQNYVQIAFEAVDNLGRGVVLDDVLIRSTPSCFKPEDLYTSNVTNHSITVNWLGSFDAEYFYVKLSKTPLTEEELASHTTQLVCDTTTDGVSIDFEDLERGAKYYCYVKSQCEHEISDWVSHEFKTANIINIPAVLDFNLSEEEKEELIEWNDEPYYMEGWYYAASDSAYKPYGDAQMLDWDEDGWKPYCSIDSSEVLVFSYNDGWYCSYMGALPANAWAYIATPEVTADVKDLQLSFESMLYYNYEAEISSIIVGVMDDPFDRSTFTPIKTITNDRRYIYNEYVVSFEDYTGTGKYITFMSDFGKTNYFTIENLTIEPRKDTPATPLFNVMMPTASTMQFNFEQNYDSYEVVLSADRYNIDREKDFPDSLTVISKHTISNLGKIENLTPDARYFVYVRGIKGGKKSKWAYPRYEEMPSRIDISTYPNALDFATLPTTIPDINGYRENWTDDEIPTIIKPLYTYTYSSLFLVDSINWVPTTYLIAAPISAKDLAISCYYPYGASTIAVFPEADLAQTKISFYAVGRYGTRTSNPATSTNYKYTAAVGVMTDANDMNSFVAIDTIELSYLEYTYYEYDFSNYPELNGKFFAIMVEDFDFASPSVTGYSNKVHVTNVVYDRSLDCKTPSDVDAVVDPYNPSKATITWNPGNVKEWNVRVAKTEYNKDQFISGGNFEFVYECKVTTPKAEITGLEYPYHKYYYWIQPVCEGIAGEWTIVRNFETFCPLIHSVPYHQNFDDAEAGSRVWTGFSADCMFTKQWTRNISGVTPSGAYYNKYYYPHVTNTYSYSGDNSVTLFKKYSTSYRNYIALPELDKPIDSLQISFRLMSLQTSASNWKQQELAIGVMENPLDINTFEQVATVIPSKAKTWERISIKLAEYTGKGKYIAIRETDNFKKAPGTSNKYAEGVNTDSVYIDNIEVNIAAPCETPYDVYASDVTSNAATINWSSDAKQFIVIVTDEILAYSDLIDFDDYKAGLLTDYDYLDNIISVDTVVGAKRVRVEGLSVNQEYYVYVKGFCGGMYTDYAVDYTFSTFCPALDPESFLGNFTDATAGQLPDCWFVGKAIGEYTSSTQTILNYVKVNAASTSSSTPASIRNQGKTIYMNSTNGAINSSTGKPTVNGTYLITPSLDIDKITNYKVKFKAWTSTSYMYKNCGTNDYARSVIVGVVTNPYNFETFMPVDTIEDIHMYPYPYEVYLDSYRFDLNGDTGKFVAFYSNFGIRNNIYLDDIEFERISECPRFDGTVVAKTPTSVTFRFNSYSDSYEVKAATSLSTDETLNSSTTMPTATSTSNEITVEGLRNHREYFFYARPTSDADCSDWTLVLSTYAADSLVRSLPFEDNFESNPYAATYGATPHDWYTYFYEPGDKTYPTINSSTVSSGSRSVYSYATGSGKDVYLVTPELNVDKLSKCFLQFDLNAKGSTSYPAKTHAIIIGAVSDVNDIPGTFEPFDTLHIGADQTALWVTYKMELTKYKGNAKHIAFLNSYDLHKALYPAYAYSMMYFDNVLVDLIPSCYDPYDFKQANSTDQSITISFSHEGAQEYEVIFGQSGFEWDSLASDYHIDEFDVITRKFTTTKVKFDSLYADYYYDAYIRAICSPGDTTKWSYAGSFKTLPSIVTSYPYENGFDDPVENGKWKNRYSQRRLYFGVDKDSLVADKKNSTDAALYYSADGGKTTKPGSANVAGLVYRYFNLEKGSYNFSFDWIFPAMPEITHQFLARQGLFRVLLIPASTKFGSSVVAFTTADGETLTLSWIDPETAKLPENWFDLSKKTQLGKKEYGAFFGSDITKPLEEQWQHQSVDVTITEETEGSYMLLFLHYDSEPVTTIDSLNPRVLVVDDLSVIKSECGAVSDLKAINRASKSVSLSWNTSDPTLTSYDVMILNENVNPYKATDAQKAYVGTASSTSATITGLTHATKYYIYVRPTCAGTSLWGSPIEYITDVDVPDGYTFSFEEEECLYFPPYTSAHQFEYTGDATYLNTTSMFHTWINRTLLDDNSTYQFDHNYYYYYPQIVYDSIISSYVYKVGRTGERALWMGTRTTGAWLNGATVAMPYAGEFEGKRLIFYMRPFQSRRYKTYAEDNQTVAVYYPYYTSSTIPLSKQSRKITVGTMTDPNDPKTFVALDTITYPYSDAEYSSGSSLKTKDASGDKGWYRAVLSLNGVPGKYIAFRYEQYGTETIDKTVNMFIDDVTIETIPECPAPELMKINKLKESSVEIDYFFEGGIPTTEVVIATDENFENVVKTATYNTLPFTVTGLQPLTRYYIKAKVICSDLDQSEYSTPLTFETPVAICYDNNFDNEPTHYPTNWKHTTSPNLYNYIKGATQIVNPGVPYESSTSCWKIADGIFNSGKFSTRHMLASPYSTTSSTTTYSMWAITPAFELDETAEQHLSFDMALTQKGLPTAADFSYTVDSNFTFAVVIVDDATYTTYKRENMVIWKPATSKMKYDHDFTSIPNTGMEYSIDLSKYKGKNIRVLFLFTTRGMDMHIDNVHINSFTTKEYDDSTCEYCDFEDNQFFILSDETHVGVNEFTKWVFENEDPDTLLTLNLNVVDVSEQEISATICEGDVYNNGGFNDLTQGGVYKRKFSSASRCDSIVSLSLTVVKPLVTTIIDTICFGNTYSFAGKELNRTGLYSDTLVSKVTGCDSIVNLVLTVNDVIRREHYVNICYGDTYTFGTQTISATGKYEEVFRTASGCDSLVTLHATVLPEYRQNINAVIKKGEEYNANGFKGLTRTGEYTLELKSVEGCDSVIVLNLTVLEGSYNELDVNICYGDSYQLGSQTITTTGQYTETFKAANGADSVVVVNATVLPDYRQTIEATICAGEVYTANGFTELATTGVYTQELKSVDGCDSTLTLNLTVLSGDTTRVEFTIKTTDLPYDYQGLLYYDKSTLAGTYIDTLVVETENCEEVIIHTLIVELVDAIDNVHTFDLVMVPNPVAVNGTLYINAEFSAEERDGMTVEVFNAIGQCVYVDTPSIYPIEISGLQERGMYIVRIVTGNGKSYTGKLIVE